MLAEGDVPTVHYYVGAISAPLLTEILEDMTTQVQVHAVSLKTCCMTYTQKQ